MPLTQHAWYLAAFIAFAVIVLLIGPLFVWLEDRAIERDKRAWERTIRGRR